MAGMPFGALNASVAKAVTANAPKRYAKIVEPFGDGGTYALEMAKRKPRQHVVNVVDEILFAALVAAQTMSPAGRRQMSRFDWIASQETFDAVLAITATEGPELLYRFLYLKKFGMSMEPDAPPSFDVLSAGKDASSVLMGLPLMRAALKGVTITNEQDPLGLLGSAGAGDFAVVLPSRPEDADAAEARLPSSPFFFMRKVATAEDVLDRAKKHTSLRVAGKKVASIMMATTVVITNIESRGGITPIDPEGMPEGGMSMEAA